MSKIVCDICGTTYQDTAGSCPVCGWNQSGSLNVDEEELDLGEMDAALLDDFDTPAADPSKKIIFDFDAEEDEKPAAKSNQDDDDDEEEDEEESGSNGFLVFILILLILALLAVSGYIGWTKIIKPRMQGNTDNKPQETISQQFTEPNETEAVPTVEPVTEAPTEEVSAVPCTNLSLVGSMEKLTFAGQYWRLMVKTEPEDTTDKVVYTSGNEAVVTIDEYGRVTAVGEGETVITITCGDKRVETPAVVSFAAETEPTEAPTTAAPGETAGGNATETATTPAATPSGNGTLKLKGSTDRTIGRLGVYITLELEGGVSAESVKWTTTDSSVATVYNGNVTAVGRGVCTVKGEYNGQTVECIIRVKY